VKDVQTLPGADIDCDHNLLVAKICTRLKKIIRFQKRKPRWDLGMLFAERQEVHDRLEEKLGLHYKYCFVAKRATHKEHTDCNNCCDDNRGVRGSLDRKHKTTKV
jgi:hypothetical protein